MNELFRCRLQGGRDLPFQGRRFGALLMAWLSIGSVATRACPPGVFDYGPPCPEEAQLIVIEHYGDDGPLLPPPEDCNRAARDQQLIRSALPNLADVEHMPCCWFPNELLIQTASPANEELVCTNQNFQVTSFEPLSFGNFWIITFPHRVNTAAMAEIYALIPAIIIAEPTPVGCPAGGCCRQSWLYAPLPDSMWQWTIIEAIPWHTTCREELWNVFVNEDGDVFLPGDLNCDGDTNPLDIPQFVQALLQPESVIGCPAMLADMNQDGIANGNDTRQFVETLLEP